MWVMGFMHGATELPEKVASNWFHSGQYGNAQKTLAEEEFGRIGAGLETCPKWSLVPLTYKPRLSVSSLRNATELLRLRP